MPVRHCKQVTRKLWVDRIWQSFVQCPDIFFFWIAQMSCNHTILFCKSLGVHTIQSTSGYSNTVQWIKWVKKNNSPTQKKNIHRRKFKKTTKRTTYTSLAMCLCTKFYIKGTVYASVKAKAVSHKWARNGQQMSLMHYLGYSWISWANAIFPSFVHGAVLIA